MFNKKHLIYMIIMSAILSSILIRMYYIQFYIPMSKEVGAQLGFPNEIKLLLVFILIFVLALPLSYGLLLLIDFYTDFIYPKIWMTVTLIEKHKEHINQNDPKYGAMRSGYRYTFDFQDEEGELCSFYGSKYEYECLIESTAVKIRVKRLKIRDVTLIEADV